MKVRCIYNSGKDLIQLLGNNTTQHGQFLVDSENRPLWCTSNTQFGGLEIGKEYVVIRIVFRNGLPHYLIDDGRAYLYLLFDVIENKVDAEWYFRAFEKNEKNYVNREVIFGYHELCTDDDHFMQLLEREPSALEVFLKRKIEAEQFYKNN